MTEDNKRRNIADELAKADRELAAGEALRALGSPDIAVARAYYCMLHYARALLLMEGIESKTHSGVIHQLHVWFVRTGRLSAEVARCLTTTEAERIKADYDVAVVFTDAMAGQSLSDAAQFAVACRKILSTAGYL